MSRAKISLSVSLGGGLPVMVGMNTVVLQKLKLTAQIRYDTGQVGPFAVESMSKCGISGMRLSGGYL